MSTETLVFGGISAFESTTGADGTLNRHGTHHSNSERKGVLSALVSTLRRDSATGIGYIMHQVASIMFIVTRRGVHPVLIGDANSTSCDSRSDGEISFVIPYVSKPHIRQVAPYGDSKPFEFSKARCLKCECC